MKIGVVKTDTQLLKYVFWVMNPKHRKHIFWIGGDFVCKRNGPGQGVPYGSRANKKLFTMECIGPSTTAYAHISQKMLKGAASRLIIYWLTPILVKKTNEPGASRSELQIGYISGCFFLICVEE